MVRLGGLELPTFWFSTNSIPIARRPKPASCLAVRSGRRRNFNRDSKLEGIQNGRQGYGSESERMETNSWTLLSGLLGMLEAC